MLKNTTFKSIAIKNTIMAKDENIKISFLGIKFECTNPTMKAIMIVVLFLVFFVALVVLLPALSVIKPLSG
jgi:hypothetical protein